MSIAGRDLLGGPPPTLLPEEPGAALLAAGAVALRESPAGAPRGLYCGIGVCQECRVVADGEVVRACVTPVSAGMEVVTGRP